MKEALAARTMEGDQNQRISETIGLERDRLRNFIRRHVPDRRDAEDILQDVFYELIEAYRLMKPIEHAGAWLFRVARNRIIDLFRRRRTAALHDAVAAGEDGSALTLEDLLPSADGGLEAAYARRVLLEEIEEALNELPEEQRYVFVAHEIEGQSFKEISDATGVSVNTLLSRKRYAVLHLRRRLKAIYKEFMKR